jgi:hypothetical protein
MRVFISSCSHEPKSFDGTMTRTAVEAPMIAGARGADCDEALGFEIRTVDVANRRDTAASP